MSRLFSFPGHYTTSVFHFRLFTLLRKHLWLFLASYPLCFVEDLLLFKKNYPKDQSHIEITEISEIPNTVSLVIVQQAKCKMRGPYFISQSFKNLEAVLGMVYKLLKPTRHLSEETAQVR